MKLFTLLLLAIFATVSLSDFTPVSNFNLTQLEGVWNVQSIYDTIGTDYNLTYCFHLNFTIINGSAANITRDYFDGIRNIQQEQTDQLWPDESNPAILYRDADHKSVPFVVVNMSSIPYWKNNVSDTLIIALNFTTTIEKPQYVVLGASRQFDTAYDISSFIRSNNLTINPTKNFWLINTACDAHYNWYPYVYTFKEYYLKNWSLIAVYDPADSSIIPWYTEKGIYDWTQAYCASISLQTGQETYDVAMTLSLKNLYRGSLQRTWRLVPDLLYDAVLRGFDMGQNTLLYVFYEQFGTMILTTGTTTSFLLSTNVNTLDQLHRELFEAILALLQSPIDVNYIYPIDNSQC